MMLLINDKTFAALVLLLFLAPSVSIADTSTSVFRFQQKMAEKGHAQAQYKLAMMYETGEGIEKDIIVAGAWYNRAAEQNYKPAKHRLTYLKVKQNGFKQHHEAWLKDLKRDAVFGDGEALFLLGQMYSQGIGVNQDLKKSISILKKASAANIPGSETELIRIQTKYQQQKIATNKPTVKNATQRKPKLTAEEKQKLRNQRLQRLEQQRILRQQKLIAEQQRKFAEKFRQSNNTSNATTSNSEPLLTTAPAETPVMITNTEANDICAGRNRFSATCR